MSFKRSYEDGCAAAHALDLVGERWALLIVRELVFGGKRFTDLRAGLPGISPNVLTQRLEELEQASVLRRRRLLPPAATSVYELTDWGRELAPVLVALGRWGARSPLMAPGLPVSASSLAMSLQAMLDPARAVDLHATVALHLGDERYGVTLSRGRIAVERGEPPSAEVCLSGTPSSLSAVIYGGRKLADAVKAGELVVDGDKALAKRFVGLFVLPEPAASTVEG